jgi:hypothetical protein
LRAGINRSLNIRACRLPRGWKSLTHHPPVLTFVSSPSFKTALALVRLFVDYALSMFQRITY